MTQMLDDRKKRTVTIVRRTLVPDLKVLFLDRIDQRLDQARFPDPRFSQQQNALCFACRRLGPPFAQHPKFLLAAEQRSGPPIGPGFKSAVSGTLPGDSKNAGGLTHSLQFVIAEVSEQKGVLGE